MRTSRKITRNKRIPRLQYGGTPYSYQYVDPNSVDDDYNYAKIGERAVELGAAGTTVGPWGTAIGAVVGAGLGAVEAGFEQDAARDEIKQINLNNFAGDYKMKQQAGITPSTGNNNASLYAAKGGRIPSYRPGGEVKEAGTIPLMAKSFSKYLNYPMFALDRIAKAPVNYARGAYDTQEGRQAEYDRWTNANPLKLTESEVNAAANSPWLTSVQAGMEGAAALTGGMFTKNVAKGAIKPIATGVSEMTMPKMAIPMKRIANKTIRGLRRAETKVRYLGESDPAMLTQKAKELAKAENKVFRVTDKTPKAKTIRNVKEDINIGNVQGLGRAKNYKQIPTDKLGNYKYMKPGQFREPTTGIISRTAQRFNPKKGIDLVKNKLKKTPKKDTDITSYKAQGGAVQVGAGIEVQGKPGTDTIPMTIDGQKVKLDNEEIVVRDSQGAAVVISDDLGEADEYRAALANGGNPEQVALEFAERAKRLNPNPGGDGRADGGIGRLDQYFNKYKNQYSDYMPNPSNVNGIPSIDYRDTNTYPNSYNLSNTKTTDIASDEQAAKPPPDTTKDNSLGLKAATTGLSTVFNAISAGKLANTKFPEFQPYAYKDADLDVNKQLYDKARTDINVASRVGTQNILQNTADSNAALARVGGLKSQQIDAYSDIAAKEGAERKGIANVNTLGRNRYKADMNRLKSGYDMASYGDDLGRIQTGLGFGQNVVNSLDGLITDMKQGRYDNEMISTLGSMYGVTIPEGATSQEILAIFTEARNKALKGE